MKFITTIVGFIGKILSPASQIQAVGGRRVWVALAGMVFVVIAKWLNITDEIVYAVLGLGGAFIVGESVADVKGRGGLGIGDILEVIEGDDEED